MDDKKKESVETGSFLIFTLPLRLEFKQINFAQQGVDLNDNT